MKALAEQAQEHAVPEHLGIGTSRHNGVPQKTEELCVDVLMVDDREDKLLALEAILTSPRLRIVKARSGKEALRLLLKQDFALILLDVSMPEMDGFETASLIRQRMNSEHTPIIFVTSFGDSDNHISRGYSLGAVDYIITPIVPEVLRAKVAVFVELYRKTQLIRIQSEQLRKAEEFRHQREMAGVAGRLEAETKRNRFFTLALDMLGIADLDGKLLQINPVWESVLGYTEAELTSLSALDLLHPDERPELLRKFVALREGAPLRYVEGRYRHKDGSYRWLGVTAAPFVSERLVYLFCRDITPRKEAEDRIVHLNEELARRVAALTEVNQELEAFNYSISHDLRTPLRAMSSFASALLNEESERLSPEGVDYAQRIVSASKYMDTLLKDLLNYSRLGREEMVLSTVELEKPVNELLHVLESEIKKRNVEVDIRSPLATVQAHMPTLQQILGNLLSNCLKFTAPERVPQIRLYTEDHEGFVRLWVEDNGIGIRKDYCEKIFGLFERLPDSRNHPGTGIGLALVRKGAERMGGRAGVESELGKGSRFWVDLPAAMRYSS